MNIAGASWRKSSRSGLNGCVECAALEGGTIAVRDSKNPRGAMLLFTPAEWDAFINGVRNGEFDFSKEARDG